MITFIPHPYEVLGSRREGTLINSHAEKEELMGDLHIDYLIPFKFTRDFSSKAPAEFVGQYLESPFLRAIHLGSDFSFGIDKQGDHRFIADYFADRRVEVVVHDKFYCQGEVISSSRIRHLIKRGQVGDAATLLQRPFFVRGVVVKGQGRGRKIGFPTANIDLNQQRVYPQHGVYVTKTTYRNMVYYSITNVGINPTFDDSAPASVETNIFDFDNDIYG